MQLLLEACLLACHQTQDRLVAPHATGRASPALAASPSGALRAASGRSHCGRLDGRYGRSVLHPLVRFGVLPAVKRCRRAADPSLVRCSRACLCRSLPSLLRLHMGGVCPPTAAVYRTLACTGKAQALQGFSSPQLPTLRASFLTMLSPLAFLYSSIFCSISLISMPSTKLNTAAGSQRQRSCSRPQRCGRLAATRHKQPRRLTDVLPLLQVVIILLLAPKVLFHLVEAAAMPRTEPVSWPALHIDQFPKIIAAPPTHIASTLALSCISRRSCGSILI